MTSSPALPSPSHLFGGIRKRTYSIEVYDFTETDPVARKPVTARRTSGKRKFAFEGESDAPSEMGALKSSRKPGNTSLKEATNTEDGNEIAKGIKQDAVKPKRPRAKKDGVQTKIPKGRVTKPITTGHEKPAGSGSRKAERRPRSSENGPDGKAEKLCGDDGLSASEDLCLEKALKRKARWSPPKDTIAVVDLSETMEGITEGVAQIPEMESSGNFESICRAFGFDDKSKASTSTRPFTVSTSGKQLESQSRRLGAETSDILRALGYHSAGKDSDTTKSGSAPMTKTSKTQGRTKVTEKLATTTAVASDVNGQPKPKTKLPKKKAKTITEQATAPYALDRPQPLEAPLLNYFSPETRVGDKHDPDSTKSTSHQQPVSGADTACPRGKAGVKQKTSKPRTKTKKIAPQIQPRLLSPRSACKQIEDQDFLFGTSSQLARQDPSAFHKDLQRLTDMSEGTGEPSRKNNTTARSGDDKLSGFKTSRSLWSVAAGDKSTSIAPEDPADNEGHVQKSVVPDASRGLQCMQKEGESRGEANAQLERPDFEGYATTQLASELASYGFKPTKSRKRMIALMEKCWEGKQRIALKALEANTHVPPSDDPASASSRQEMECAKAAITEQPTCGPVSAPKALMPSVTPKRPRKKAKQAAPIDVDPTGLQNPPVRTRGGLSTVPESPLQDSMPPPTAVAMTGKTTEFPKPSSLPSGPPSPTGSVRSLTSSSPFAIAITSAAPDDAAVQARRFASITRAIRSEAPSAASATPTWHEKILMFDPIVLEDLAVWLNTQGLGAIGEDFEVGPAEVKSWCLQNSICCLWRENMWGNGRTRR
ncbi:MAG: 5'-flap endonuclease [Peltula sp. TS41687]|nr:MAG: 5'-flap endonuclease [Peltula sp. TS41687]